LSRTIFRSPARVGLALALALAASTLVGTGAATGAPAGAVPSYRSCAKAPAKDVGPGVRCLSTWHRAPAGRGSGRSTTAVAAPGFGLGPADIRGAYALPAVGGKGQTIAIVDAYDNPNVEKDLAAYRAAYGLPACTTANHCFTKVDQRGGKKYPDGDPGWGVEISLDVQAVSAACSACSILLVEADDSSFEAIGEAVNTAVRLGAAVVSNSYGADEFGTMFSYGRRYYSHPGVPIVASSGDYGFTTASFPAVLSSTWAIGGTTLTADGHGGWSEEAWWGSGSGCSAWVAKPAVQHDPNCQMRTVADISAVADGPEGFAVYDTYGLGADNGWISVGGTSLSAPLISAMIGLAGNAAAVVKPSYAYQHPGGLKDVVGGSNGYCGDDYLCTGVRGYDAPTGLGSPRGLKSL
jgi:subtilase family serine protease